MSTPESGAKRPLAAPDETQTTLVLAGGDDFGDAHAKAGVGLNRPSLCYKAASQSFDNRPTLDNNSNQI